MRSIKSIFIVITFTCFFTEVCFAIEKDCGLNLHHFIGKSSTTKIRSTEWSLWNKRFSDIETARHQEFSTGVWGFGRLRDGIHPLHTHVQEEWYFIQSGSGLIQVGSKLFRVEPGDNIHIPGDVQHSISKHSESTEDLVFEYYFPNVKDFENTVKYNWLKKKD